MHLTTRSALALVLASTLLTGCAQASAPLGLAATPSAVASSASAAALTAAASPVLPSSLVSAPASATDAPPADLVQTLAQLPVPPGSVRLTKPTIPDQPDVRVANAAAKKTAVGYWTTPLSRDATAEWLAQHLPPTWKGGGLGASGDTQMLEYDRQRTAELEGPNLTISVAPTTTGSSVIVTAWEIRLTARSAYEMLTDVSGATLSTKDDVAPLDVPPLRSVALDAAQTQQLAKAINALSVDDGSPHSCTAGTPDVVLDFTTASGHRKFLYSRNCHGVTPVGDGNGPTLNALGPLYELVAALLKASTGPVRGTLIVTLATSSHSNQELPGSITIAREGKAIDRGDIASDRVYITTEPPGPYKITAISDGHTCRPGTATVVADQQVDVTLLCPPSS